MPRSRTRLRALALPLCVAAPIGVAIVLNTAVRPRIAERLGGTRITHHTTFKSADGWWEFGAGVRAAHPAATGFLELSDGAIVMIGVAVAAIVCAALLASDRRTRSEKRARARSDTSDRAPRRE
ncbi:hypothetical protein [Leucobacter aridicollis]|uniref:hypothetical protein n=1 Tax=Leucobacter aridicollis TaxID=283878 RepID=UPI0037C62D73